MRLTPIRWCHTHDPTNVHWNRIVGNVDFLYSWIHRETDRQVFSFGFGVLGGRGETTETDRHFRWKIEKRTETFSFSSVKLLYVSYDTDITIAQPFSWWLIIGIISKRWYILYYVGIFPVFDFPWSLSGIPGMRYESRMLMLHIIHCRMANA